MYDCIGASRLYNAIARSSFSFIQVLSLSVTLILATFVNTAAAQPSDPNEQIRVNQMAYYPDATKTAILMRDGKISDEPGAENFHYQWRAVRFPADGSPPVDELVSTGTSLGYFEQSLSHPLGPMHAGKSDRVLSRDHVDKFFFNATDKTMYEWNFSNLTTEGAYRIILVRWLDGGAGEILYSSPFFEIGTQAASSKYLDMSHHALMYYYLHRLGWNYGSLPINAVDRNVLQANGVDTIYERGEIHGDAVPCVNKWCGEELLGEGTGWADAGDFGQYPVNHAMAVWQMLNAVEFSFDDTVGSSVARTNIPDVQKVVHPVTGNRMPVVEEVLYGSDYFKNLLPTDSNKLAPHKLHNNEWGVFGAWTVDWQNNGNRFATVPSTAATYAVCRVGAHIARLLYKTGDTNKAKIWWDVAQEARNRANNLPEVFYPSSYNVSDLIDGAGPYNDKKITDDRYACNVETYLTYFLANQLGINGFTLTGLSNERASVRSSAEFYDSALQFANGLDWLEVAATANLSLLTVDNDLPAWEKDALKSSLLDTAKSKAEMLTPYGFKMSNGRYQTFNPRLPTTLANNMDEGDPNIVGDEKIGKWNWGSNSILINDLQLIVTAAHVTGTANEKLELNKAALHGMDYLLGQNAMNLSFITGYGQYSETDTHDRWIWNASYDDDTDTVLASYPKGWLSGGPQSDWRTCVVKEVGYDRPYETGSPFWYEISGIDSVISTDLVFTDARFKFFDAVGDEIKATVTDTLINALLTNTDAVTPEPFYETASSPLILRAPASSYAGPLTAPDAWCTKENTINWNSGLIWMASAATHHLPSKIGNAPNIPPPAPGGGGNVSVKFEVFDEFSNGYCARTIFTNNSNQWVDWVAEFDVRPNHDIYDFWNVAYTQTGDHVVATASDDASWGERLAPGASTNPEWFGFCAATRNIPDDGNGGGDIPPGISVDVVINNRFNGGYCADVTIYNNSDRRVNPWPINFVIQGTLNQSWNMSNVSQNVNAVSADHVGWNQYIEAHGQSQSLGFCAKN